jgi:hypothetical protein
MPHYTIEQGDAAQRQAVREWLHGIDLVNPQLQERIVTAWVTSWVASPYDHIEQFPYSASAPAYGLSKHVNDVTGVGLDLATRAANDWGMAMEPDVLVPILILHDVDKPLMMLREGDRVVPSPISRELAHGVLGAMILKDLGFSDTVISAVSLHAGNAPFHGSNFESMTLHYADYFSTDYVYRQTEHKPFYQRPWR